MGTFHFWGLGLINTAGKTLLSLGSLGITYISFREVICPNPRGIVLFYELWRLSFTVGFNIGPRPHYPVILSSICTSNFWPSWPNAPWLCHCVPRLKLFWFAFLSCTTLFESYIL